MAKAQTCTPHTRHVGHFSNWKNSRSRTRRRRAQHVKPHFYKHCKPGAFYTTEAHLTHLHARSPRTFNIVYARQNLSLSTQDLACTTAASGGTSTTPACGSSMRCGTKQGQSMTDVLEPEQLRSAGFSLARRRTAKIMSKLQYCTRCAEHAILVYLSLMWSFDDPEDG